MIDLSQLDVVAKQLIPPGFEFSGFTRSEKTIDIMGVVRRGDRQQPVYLYGFDGVTWINPEEVWNGIKAAIDPAVHILQAPPSDSKGAYATGWSPVAQSYSLGRTYTKSEYLALMAEQPQVNPVVTVKLPPEIPFGTRKMDLQEEDAA